MIRLEGIQKYFNRGTVNESHLFRGFNLNIQDGDFVSVVGSNGSGKTTMLNILCGSLPCDGGRILVDGRDVTALPEHRRAAAIGRVYQDPAMGTVPDMTILENLSLAANKGKPYGFTPAVSRRKAGLFRELVTSVGLGLEDRMDIPVGSLSGGQRQALSLLMSTMTPIDLLILDEHTAALDPKTAETVMQITGRIVAEKGVTTLMVTHNLRYAVEYGNRMLMMHEGRAVLDVSGADKQAVQVSDLLRLFNEISVECGN